MAGDYGVGALDEISRLSVGDNAEGHSPAAPNMDSPGVVAVDITDKFSRASKALAPGEVVKDALFTLFESVGALEIMDPKMDSGCVEPGDEFEELYDVSKSLLPEEVLGIIDQLLCHEMSWHLGYPLSQTVLTSVYVEALLMPNPQGIEDAKFVRRDDAKANDQPMLQILRAYCLGMLKACSYVNERVKSEHSYEEEDFVTNTYNRTLLANVSTESIRQAIEDAVDLLKAQRDSIGGEIADALTNRLKLRAIFLSATECPQYVAQPKLARQPWDEGITILPYIQSSHHLGKSVDESFSAKLQRKLASTIPPRPIVKLEFDDAFGHLSRLFKDGKDVISVLHFTNSQCLLNFVFYFQAKKPQPLVYVRTLLQTFLFDAMEMLGTMSIRQILDEDFSIVTLPASILLDRANDDVEFPLDPRHLIAQKMELFRQRAAQPYLDILRTFCQNRCRVRRTLCHTIRAWDSLQADAEEVDHILQTKTKEMLDQGQGFSAYTTAVDTDAWSLSAWTYMYKLRQMEWIVQLGFELEVYQPDEFVGMYWYLNYLSKLRLEYAPRIKNFIVKKHEELRAQSKANPVAQEQLTRAFSFIRLSLLDAAVTWELSDALSCIYTVLGRLGLVKAPARPYSDDKLRYEIRMKPFEPIGIPELPSYELFQKHVSQSESSDEEILAVASKAIAGVKKNYESLSKLSAEESFSVESHDRWMGTVKNGLKSCISMGLVVTTLQKATQRVKEGGELSLKAVVPMPDEAYHEWWIVPKLEPVA